MEDESECIKYLKGFDCKNFRPEFKSNDLEAIHQLLIEKIGSWYEIKLIITRKEESIYFKIAGIESI